ncbi:hypothetical protein CHS0354_000997 [Potamilus streckersoni]|uniref:glutathione transferase n=1 Tax=Potamilus streckersoni TaxID=2493646 RepID=A0AAE0WCQ4_9BIVA|nr:hypothetical protein CHS0354_000997 [Potamilus streckersoni]
MSSSKVMKMPEYRLHYFNGRGAAEPARILFALADVEYEDVRYEREDWPAKKPGMPLQALPVLEIDGKMMTQSHAIIRYLAREYGFNGTDNMETFRIDEIHEAIVELQRELYKFHFENDEAKKKEVRQSLVDTIIPKFMNFFERRITENHRSGGYFVGDGITLADVLVYNIIFNIEKSQMVSLDNWPKTAALCKKVASHPKIADWLKKRPQTEF